MRSLGIGMCIVGIAGALGCFLLFDPSLPGPFGMRIANLDLVSQRQNGIIVFSVIAVIGAVLAVGSGGTVASGSAGERKCPFCAEIIRREAIVCKHCGRDVPRIEGPIGPWQCPYCSTENRDAAAQSCAFCSMPRQVDVNEVPDSAVMRAPVVCPECAGVDRDRCHRCAGSGWVEATSL